MLVEVQLPCLLCLILLRLRVSFNNFAKHGIYRFETATFRRSLSY